MGETAARRATTAAERCKNMVDGTIEERRWFVFVNFVVLKWLNYELRITLVLGK